MNLKKRLSLFVLPFLLFTSCSENSSTSISSSSEEISSYSFSNYTKSSMHNRKREGYLKLKSEGLSSIDINCPVEYCYQLDKNSDVDLTKGNVLFNLSPNYSDEDDETDDFKITANNFTSLANLFSSDSSSNQLSEYINLSNTSEIPFIAFEQSHFKDYKNKGSNTSFEFPKEDITLGINSSNVYYLNTSDDDVYSMWSTNSSEDFSLDIDSEYGDFSSLLSSYLDNIDLIDILKLLEGEDLTQLKNVLGIVSILTSLVSFGANLNVTSRKTDSITYYDLEISVADDNIDTFVSNLLENETVSKYITELDLDSFDLVFSFYKNSNNKTELSQVTGNFSLEIEIVDFISLNGEFSLDFKLDEKVNKLDDDYFSKLKTDFDTYQVISDEATKYYNDSLNYTKIEKCDISASNEANIDNFINSYSNLSDDAKKMIGTSIDTSTIKNTYNNGLNAAKLATYAYGVLQKPAITADNISIFLGFDSSSLKSIASSILHINLDSIASLYEYKNWQTALSEATYDIVFSTYYGSELLTAVLSFENTYIQNLNTKKDDLSTLIENVNQNNNKDNIHALALSYNALDSSYLNEGYFTDDLLTSYQEAKESLSDVTSDILSYYEDYVKSCATLDDSDFNSVYEAYKTDYDAFVDTNLKKISFRTSLTSESKISDFLDNETERVYNLALTYIKESTTDTWNENKATLNEDIDKIEKYCTDLVSTTTSTYTDKINTVIEVGDKLFLEE